MLPTEASTSGRSAVRPSPMISYCAVYGTLEWPERFFRFILFWLTSHLRSHSASCMCLLIIRCHGLLAYPGTNCRLFQHPPGV